MNDVPWAKRVNSRWIVHHDLDQNAEAYLIHLSQTDPQRLDISCRNARWMVEQARMEDPKPWFYAGLFSLATPEETAKFLAGHWLTKIVIDTAQENLPDEMNVGESTLEKIRRLQDALTRLPS